MFSHDFSSIILKEFIYSALFLLEKPANNTSRYSPILLYFSLSLTISNIFERRLSCVVSVLITYTKGNIAAYIKLKPALSLLKSNVAYWTGFCTFPASYTQCFFYYRIASTMNFNCCQRTSIFTYSAGNTSFFIDTCHSFFQCFVPLSNLVSLLYLKKVNSSVILLHKNLP